MTTQSDALDVALTAVVETIQGGEYQPGRRIQLHVAYCHLVIEHECAIAQLLEAKMHASAFALARPTFEALVKGLWLFHCADENDVESHAQGKELDKLGQLTDALLLTPLPPVIARSLHQVKSKYWKALSSLTHVGHTQIRHWLSPKGVHPNYPEAALAELANFASFMVLVAGRELALRAGNKAGATRLMSMLPADPPA